VPLGWTLAWVAYLGRGWLAGRHRSLRVGLTALPQALLMITGYQMLSPLFLALSLVNAAAYAWLARRQPRQWCLWPLAGIALAGSLVHLPVAWWPTLFGHAPRVAAGGVAVLLLAVLLGAWRRHPVWGVVGAAATAVLAYLAARHLDLSAHWGLQLGAAYLLAHSLRWPAAGRLWPQAVRGVTMLAWWIGTLAWLHFDLTWVSVTGSSALAAVVLGASWLSGAWHGDERRLVAWAGVGIAVLQPLYPLMDAIVVAGPSMMAIAGAFVLFGLGTCLACNRERWLAPPALPPPPPLPPHGVTP
jgi:hypothetical protein